jgi:3-hydroxyisobutyrate dehydrogenase-like beta-hydroxyacid dehydrogenase
MNTATDQLKSLEINTPRLSKGVKEGAVDVSIIGLGPMGLALAYTLLHNRYKTTVWNRSSTKAASLVQEGATFAPNIIDAINASPIVIICVADYKAANSILRTGSALAGRVLIQLSTGSPQEARDAEAWAKEHKIDYLDGAILVAPSQIGGADSAMLVSGSRSAFQKSERILKTLAVNLSYLGEEVGSASALDLAFLSHFFGGLLGFYHGAKILEAEGLPVTMLGSMIAEVAPALGEIIKHDANVIHSNDYSQPESSLRNSATIVELILRQAQEARINAEFPTFAATLFEKGIEAGYETEDVAALVKVLRQENG